MIMSSTKELFSPLENPKQKFCSRRRLFETSSLVESNSPEFDQFSDIEEQSEEEVRETMTEIMEQYMSKTRGDYGSGVTRPKINQDAHFELKGKFLKELFDSIFSGSEHEDANEHIEKVLEICMIMSSTKELFSPLENPKQKFCSRRRLFETSSLVESNSPEFDQFSDIEEQSEEEVRETMTEIMEQYMSKTRGDYESGITRPKINQDAHFELKGKFLKELFDSIFSGSEHEDANEHIKKVLEIVDLFHIPK
ncbi:hypothetical protein Tco_0635061 [Tanacetum coccineum]